MLEINNSLKIHHGTNIRNDNIWMVGYWVAFINFLIIFCNIKNYFNKHYFKVQKPLKSR